MGQPVICKLDTSNYPSFLAVWGVMEVGRWFSRLGRAEYERISVAGSGEATRPPPLALRHCDRNPFFVNIQANKSGMFHKARLLCMRLFAGQPA